MTALANWVSMINYLAIRDISNRFNRTPVAAILTLLAPLLALAGILIIRGFLKGRFPQFGHSLAVFYASGIFPFFVFMRLALSARRTSYHPARRLPGVRSTDTLVAFVLGDAATILTSTLICFVGLWLYGLIEAKPVSMGMCLIALFFLGTFGVGLGLINSAIARHFRLWGFVYAQGTRGLIFLSGVFHVVDLTPIFIRNIIVLNPITHGIEWFRLGLYGNYPVHTLDRSYLMWATGICLFLGLVAHIATIRSTGRR